MITLLKKAADAKRFDSRVVEKNLNRGLISARDLEAHLHSLKDDEAQGDWIDLTVLRDETDMSGKRRKSFNGDGGNHHSSNSLHASNSSDEAFE